MFVAMKDGPLAGIKYDGIWELMDAQAELRRVCPHDETRIESGRCGPDKRHWQRERCTQCQAVL